MGKVDARLRVVGALAFAVVTALLTSPAAALLALGVGGALGLLAWLPAAVWLRRLLPLNAMLLALALLLPLSGGSPSLALLVALKANAILLALTALLSTLEPVQLGHALQQLRCPPKLTHLLLFTVRYLDVLHREFERLRTAMRARAFQPRLDRHTLRTYGYLVGMLLVRAFERAERIEQAMRCRGFRGRYPTVAAPNLGAADLVYAAALGCAVVGIAVGGWLWT
jgi:cobalt/nickel transport system permease protein